jgi:hypothetical protein
MSTEPPRRSLAEYVSELMVRLGSADPAALARLREIVGARRAAISLDDEAIEIRWARDRFQVTPAGAGQVDGTGATDRQTVLDLVAGRLEIHEAILDGRLHVIGEIGDVERIFLAIEVLLDAAARAPALQALAEDYRADPCRPRRRRVSRAKPPVDTERDVLNRLDLLPEWNT